MRFDYKGGELFVVFENDEDEGSNQDLLREAACLILKDYATHKRSALDEDEADVLLDFITTPFPDYVPVAMRAFYVSMLARSLHSACIGWRETDKERSDFAQNLATDMELASRAQTDAFKK